MSGTWGAAEASSVLLKRPRSLCHPDPGMTGCRQMTALRRVCHGRTRETTGRGSAGGSSHPPHAPTIGLMSKLRAALAAVGMLAAAACGQAVAAPGVPAGPQPVAPAASVELVNRLAAAAETAVPDVAGLPLPEAKRRLTGLQVRVVSFNKRGGNVSAQWPTAGEPRPADSTVVVWVGKPPTPPPARKVAVDAPGTAIVTTGEVPTLVGEAAAVERTPGETGLVTVEPVPDVGITPGLENMVPPPHGPRANIRTLAPAKAGTAYAGRASWYGPGFAGRGTACGTTFDPSELTLASRELRCGTKVVVTGPSGSVDATVTDWGPAEWTDRRFDLSQATMAAIGGLSSGVVDVTVVVR